MTTQPDVNLWTSSEHALQYLRRVDSIPHRPEGEATLLDFIPAEPKRILDLGSGAGRLLELVMAVRPSAEFVALDFSPPMLEQLRQKFGGDPRVTIVQHDFANPLPKMGSFDAVLSSVAIHHVLHDRKRALYTEIFEILRPGGVFCNLEHVDSPTPELHAAFLKAIGRQEDDPSNKLLDVQTQLLWLREIGFLDVDCHWKWREFALLAGVKPRE
jgi:tRNA (cmo5U34)-methyltransferase